MNLKTATVTSGPVRREIRAFGTLAFNEEGLRDVTVKFEGWLENLHVPASWSAVQKDDPLFDIYSPALLNAQLNFLAATSDGADPSGPLARAALARLKLLDVPQAFLDALAASRQPARTLTVRSPASGVLIEKNAVAGQMVKPGELICRLADLSSVWALVQIYESDLPFVSENSVVSVRETSPNGRVFNGKIQRLLPQIQAASRSATARIVLPNSDGSLRPGQFVEARLSAEIAPNATLVPDSAVLRGGERDSVFVALDGGLFEPRQVKLGARSGDGFYQVLSGLTPGERVVTSGQFLLDSESRLREAVQKMLPSTPPQGAEQPAAAATPPPPEPATPTPTPPSAPAPLRALFLAAADAADALANDDLPAFRRRLPALREAPASAPSLAPSAGNLSDASLDAARRSFEPFSDALARLAPSHPSAAAGLRVFECGMSPVLGAARWLQRAHAAPKNPFFGSAMLSCGREIPAASN
ncbi:MAG: efflux RND transporter periplasmic adaptor subunit [Opitutaceae bacterium]|nr:efflux RND transporter periplasmic adaptor subunit [Opitutaceae bacterium]